MMDGLNATLMQLSSISDERIGAWEAVLRDYKGNTICSAGRGYHKLLLNNENGRGYRLSGMIKVALANYSSNILWKQIVPLSWSLLRRVAVIGLKFV
jgi:hypothetical protein